MGWIKAKCEQCWDSIPCGCDKQKDRDNVVRNAPTEETNRLLRRQNELLEQLAKRPRRESD